MADELIKQKTSASRRHEIRHVPFLHTSRVCASLGQKTVDDSIGFLTSLDVRFHSIEIVKIQSCRHSSKQYLPHSFNLDVPHKIIGTCKPPRKSADQRFLSLRLSFRLCHPRSTPGSACDNVYKSPLSSISNGSIQPRSMH